MFLSSSENSVYSSTYDTEHKRQSVSHHRFHFQLLGMCISLAKRRDSTGKPGNAWEAEIRMVRSNANIILTGMGTRGLLVTSRSRTVSWMLEPSQASVIPTTQVQQRFLVVILGVLLDVVVQGLAILSLEFRPNFNMSTSLQATVILSRTLSPVLLPFVELYSWSAKYRGLFQIHWTEFRKAFSRSPLTFFLMLSNMS